MTGTGRPASNPGMSTNRLTLNAQLARLALQLDMLTTSLAEAAPGELDSLSASLAHVRSAYWRLEQTFDDNDKAAWAEKLDKWSVAA